MRKRWSTPKGSVRRACVGQSWRRLRGVLVPWWLLPAHVICLAFREVEVHDLVFDVGDVGRGNVRTAAKTDSRREYVVLAHALDGAKAAPVIADDRPAGLQVRHAHALSTSSSLTCAYLSSERAGRRERPGADRLLDTNRDGAARVRGPLPGVGSWLAAVALPLMPRRRCGPVEDAID